MVSLTLDLTDRKSLMASLPKGGIGAEIGVSEGCFSDVLLEVCKPAILFLVDPWVHVASAALRNDPANVGQKGQEARYTQVRQRLGSEPAVSIVRMYSLEAAKSFEDNFFDWVHIDADHTRAGEDAEAWWSKVKPGGWLTGHDYTMVENYITVKADVDRFVAERGLKLFVTRGDNDVYERNYPTWAIRKS